MNDATAEQRRVRPVFLVRLVVILAILGFVFFFPRLIVRLLGEASPWTSYLYQYGLGLGFFLIGIRLILKTGACRLGRGRDSFWFGVLIVGFFFFAILHAVWILAALNIPFLGNGIQ